MFKFEVHFLFNVNKAGDHVKFNLPMASSAHLLSWGLEIWRDAYQSAGQLDMMYDMLKWPLDYFLKCWNPQTQEYYAQVKRSCIKSLYNLEAGLHSRIVERSLLFSGFVLGWKR